jgi:hypothetical protein
VSQTGVVTWLAVRELWISFRLLALLAAYVGVGTLVALLPAPAPTTLSRLSIGLAAGMIVGAGVAAESLSAERVLGRAGWLVTRSITRGTLLVGWFVAVAGISLIGLASAAALGWLAAAPSASQIEAAEFVAVVGGVAAMSLALVAIGLLLGSLLEPVPAMVAAVVVGLLLAAATYTVLPESAVPLTALAALPSLDRPIASGVQGAGVGLAITALALVLARVALGRVDL